jgi:surface protein
MVSTSTKTRLEKKMLMNHMLKRSRNTNTKNTPPKKVQKKNRKKIIKVRRQGGITLKAAPGAKVGDTEIIDGEVYTIRSEAQLRNLIRQQRFDEVRRTCTSFIRSMHNMFDGGRLSGVSSFNEPIGHWDTSNVTNMEWMFYNARDFNQPIGTWDTSNVTTMERMFAKARNFNQPIGTWNTSNVANMRVMFFDARMFNQPIGTWNTRNVKDMSWMFVGATSFNKPIGTWNTRNVKNMIWMFVGATSFNQPIANWDIRNVMFMRDMFKDSGFTQDITAWKDKLNPNVIMDPDTRSRIFKLNISRAQFAFHKNFHTNAEDPIHSGYVNFNRAHILVPELIKNSNVHHIRRVYDTESINRGIRPTMKSPFTRKNLAPGDIIKLSTLANKLVPGSGNTKKRLKNQYERLVVEAELRDVNQEIKSIINRKIPNAAKQKILASSPYPKQRKILQNKLRSMKK